MIQQFKYWLNRISRLSHQDQRWLIKNLSPEARLRFEAQGGDKLLLNAQRFRKLKVAAPQITAPKAISLPSYCQELANQHPLWIAIILEEGQFTWKDKFLTLYDLEGYINTALEECVPSIKHIARSTLFQHWQNQLSIDAHWEINHG